MAATYTAGSGSDKDRVRLLIADTNVSGSNALLQDEEITDLVAMQGNKYAAAATALRIIAASEVLVQKKIKLLDIQTDGPAVADALLKMADTYDAMASSEDGGFEIIELGMPENESKLRFNNYLRGGSD